MLAPALAALSATGIVMFWRAYRDGRRTWALPTAVTAELVWSVFLCFLYPDFLPWLPWLLMAVGAGAIAALTLAHRKGLHRGGWPPSAWWPPW